jgi:hypothetical protein
MPRARLQELSMRRSGKVLLVLGGCALMAAAPASPVHAQAAGGNVSIFIARAFKGEPGDKTELNKSVENLTSGFSAVQVGKDGKADYQLLALTISRQNEEKASVSAQYLVRGRKLTDDDTISAWSKSRKPGEQVKTAFDELLARTIFHPKLGPYGFLRITNCTVDSEGLTLELRLTRGLEGHLVYELGEETPAEPVRLGVFYHLDILFQNQTTARARISGEPTVSGKVLKSAPDCERLKKPGSVLLMRLLAPSTEEGSRHGIERSLG